jgi:hypothetical protein
MSTGGIVLVHGSFHSAACWDAVLAHLNMPAVAVDLPVHVLGVRTRVGPAAPIVNVNSIREVR